MFIFNNLTNNKENFDYEAMAEFMIKQQEAIVDRANKHYEIERKHISYGEREKPFIEGLGELLNGKFIKFDDELKKYVVDERLILCKVYQMANGRLKNENLIQVLRDYVGFEEVELIGSVEGVKVEDPVPIVSKDKLKEVMAHSNIGCIIRMAIDQHEWPALQYPRYQAWQVEKVLSSFPNIEEILNDKKREFKKVVKMYNTLHKAKVDKGEAIITAVELWKDGVRPHLLKDRLNFAMGFELLEKFRPLEREKIEQLKLLVGQELTTEEARLKLKLILGYEVKQPKGYLEKVFKTKPISRRADNGRTKVVKIMGFVSLDDLYNINFSKLKKSFDKKVAPKNDKFEANNVGYFAGTLF